MFQYLYRYYTSLKRENYQIKISYAFAFTQKLPLSQSVNHFDCEPIQTREKYHTDSNGNIAIVDLFQFRINIL